MKNYLEEIEKKLRDKIKIEKVEIIDNSYKHKSHKFFSADKVHLQIKIKSLYLQSISRVNAQKLIMKVLKEDLNSKIHALEINIEQ
tara:strand:+ start:466 stop:723 length:258 start_codon:yes stop_codon:yes gene_type:complete